MAELNKYLALTHSGREQDFANYLKLNSISYQQMEPLRRFFIVECTTQQYLKMIGRPELASIEEDFDANAFATQVLTSTLSSNWGLDRIDQRSPSLNGEYRFNRDGAGVDIYIVDTGVMAAHRELSGRVNPLFDGVNETGLPLGADGNGHGTHVAGIAAGITHGVARAANIHTVKVLNSSGRGSSSIILLGMNSVLAHHNAKTSATPSVVNMSIGFSRRSTTIDAAVTALVEAGIVVVVAAGNSNEPAANISPAGAPDSFTVGAIGFNDSRASFSNFTDTAPEDADPDVNLGTEQISNTGSAVDIFAPGVSILSAYPKDSKTSFMRIDAPAESVLATVPAGTEILNTRFRVFTPYDGSSRIRVGTRTNPTLLFDGDPTFLGRIQDRRRNGLGIVIPDADQIIIQYDRGTSNEGVFQATIDYTTTEGTVLFSGTSMSSPHAAGVAALYLQDKTVKPTTRAEVEDVWNWLIDNSTKNTIPDLPVGTPNRVLYSFYTQSSTFQWITPAGVLDTVSEQVAYSRSVSAEYINELGSAGTVVYSSLDLPAFLSISSGGSITGTTPDVTEDTAYTFTVTATAPTGETLNRTFTLNVQIVPNKPPVWITSPGVIKVGVPAHDPAEGETVNYQLEATDPEGSALTFSLLTGENPSNPGEIGTTGLFMDNAGLITGTVSSIIVDQTVAFTVRVTDGDLVTDRNFSFNLIATNVAPTWQPAATEPVQLPVVLSGDFYNLSFGDTLGTHYAQDADGDPLTFSVISGSLPAGVTLSTSGDLQGTVTVPGIYQFTVQATDGVLSATRIFEIEVLDVAIDQAPIWVTSAGVLVDADEGSLVSVNLSAIDPEALTVTYTLDLQPGESIPAGITLNPTGLISGVLPDITVTQVTHTFTVVASDPGGNEVPRTFQITINNAYGETAPEWVTPAGDLGSFEEFSTAFIQLEAETESGTITYSLSLGLGESFPDGLTLNPLSGMITGEPTNVDSDTVFTFTVIANNGFLAVSRTFSLTILNVTDPETLIVQVPITGYDRKLLHDAALHVFVEEQVNSVDNSLEVFIADAEDFGSVIEPTFITENLEDPPGSEPTDPVNVSEDAGSVTEGIDGVFIVVPIDPPVRDSDFEAKFEIFGEGTSSFGIVTNPHIYMAGGLSIDPVTGQELGTFFDLLGPHHRLDECVFGNFGSSPVHDLNGTHFADIVYVEVWDRQEGTAESRAYPQAPGPANANPPGINTIYPPSLVNKRNTLIADIGLPGQELAPLWQRTEISGETVGWQPWVVLAYTQPGKGSILVDNISPEIKKLVRNRPLTVDRYEVRSTVKIEGETTFEGPTTFVGPTRFTYTETQRVEKTLIKFPPGDVAGVYSVL